MFSKSRRKELHSLQAHIESSLFVPDIIPAHRQLSPEPKARVGFNHSVRSSHLSPASQTSIKRFVRAHRFRVPKNWPSLNVPPLRHTYFYPFQCAFIRKYSDNRHGGRARTRREAMSLPCRRPYRADRYRNITPLP
ncbi:hypothetical protein EVAR_12539_1 [Eumeta japonica]|uniref:Uncharacterized protein n=1 Tax=Eumeta variegata TaxID=151549 RepID=A0A4C1TPQ5_EUMVA|nr:hypothetical protein EVAR_12539_1 [Eumeta japonica]